MNNMIWLMRRMFGSTFRRKRNWLLYFGLPIAGALLAMLFYGSINGSKLTIGLVNEDGGAVAQDTIRFIEGLRQVEVKPVDHREALNAAIADGKLDTGIVIEQGFSESVRAGQPGHIDIVSIKGAQVTGYVKAMLDGYIGNVAAIGIAAGSDQAAFDRVYGSYRAADFKLAAETVEDASGVKDVTNQSVGYLLMFMMFSAVNLTELILKEKENRTFLRLLASPVSSRTYVLANVGVNLIVMLLQIAAMLVFMRYVFHVDSGVPLWQLATILLVFALVAVGLSLAIVAFAKNGAAAGALQNLIITPSCLLAGCFFPMEIMPESVQKISNFMPQHWLLDTVNKLQEGAPLGSLYMNLAIMLAFAAAFALIAIYRFGRNNDTRMFV